MTNTKKNIRLGIQLVANSLAIKDTLIEMWDTIFKENAFKVEVHSGNYVLTASNVTDYSGNLMVPVAIPFEVQFVSTVAVKLVEPGIYPNPSGGLVNIVSVPGFQSGTILIMNSSGNVIESVPFNKSLQMDLTHLPDEIGRAHV